MGRAAFQLSPFSHLIWLYRDVTTGALAHPISWVVAPLFGVGALMLGYRAFRGLRHVRGCAMNSPAVTLKGISKNFRVYRKPSDLLLELLSGGLAIVTSRP